MRPSISLALVVAVLLLFCGCSPHPKIDSHTIGIVHGEMDSIVKGIEVYQFLEGASPLETNTSGFVNMERLWRSLHPSKQPDPASYISITEGRSWAAKKQFVDPWGVAYRLRMTNCNGAAVFVVMSAGRDGAWGTSDDIQFDVVRSGGRP